ncbi:MAG: YadA-like family protein, partial [Alphaproteobacteria bacterium]|nr:YadA-like family protein [Alphaproteobacteria bacterium]
LSSDQVASLNTLSGLSSDQVASLNTRSGLRSEQITNLRRFSELSTDQITNLRNLGGDVFFGNLQALSNQTGKLQGLSNMFEDLKYSADNKGNLEDLVNEKRALISLARATKETGYITKLIELITHADNIIAVSDQKDKLLVLAGKKDSLVNVAEMEPKFDPSIDSFSLGKSAKADGEGSVAIGRNAKVLSVAGNSAAFGKNSLATEPNVISVGRVGNLRRIVNVADATGNKDAANLGQLDERSRIEGDGQDAELDVSLSSVLNSASLKLGEKDASIIIGNEKTQVFNSNLGTKTTSLSSLNDNGITSIELTGQARSDAYVTFSRTGAIADQAAYNRYKTGTATLKVKRTKDASGNYVYHYTNAVRVGGIEDPTADDHAVNYRVHRIAHQENKELIEANIDEISANGSRIMGNTEKITGNTEKIETNETAISGANVRIDGANEKIQTNKYNITKNETAIIAANVRIDGANEKIQTNKYNITKNETAIIAANVRIDGNKESIETLVDRFKRESFKRKEVDRETFSGIASLAAMSNIPAFTGDNRKALGLAFGSYNGYMSLAAGASFRLKDNFNMKVSLAHSLDEDTLVAGFGVSYSW